MAVEVADMQRVVARYLTRENQTVATYLRKAGSGTEALPEELAALPAEAQRGILAQLRQIRTAESAADLEQLLTSLAEQKGAVPPEFAPALALMERAAAERLAELRNPPAEEAP